MHDRITRRKVKVRNRVANWSITIGSAVLTFGLLIILGDKDIPRKWVTAAMGTLFTFGSVIYACRQSLLRWSFWVSLSICFTIHCLFVWIFFQEALQGMERFSIWFWLPVMLIELFVLLIALKRLERMLTGRNEETKLNF